jgi:hypothetical protein
MHYRASLPLQDGDPLPYSPQGLLAPSRGIARRLMRLKTGLSGLTAPLFHARAADPHQQSTVDAAELGRGSRADCCILEALPEGFRTWSITGRWRGQRRIGVPVAFTVAVLHYSLCVSVPTGSAQRWTTRRKRMQRCEMPA